MLPISNVDTTNLTAQGGSGDVADESRRNLHSFKFHGKVARPPSPVFAPKLTDLDSSRAPGSPEPASPAEIRSRKKPSMPRRASTKPYRGQEFSVDDASKEVDEDTVQQRQVRMASGSLRRQPSTIRRRTTAQTRLPFIENADYDDDPPTPQPGSASKTSQGPPEIQEDVETEIDGAAEETSGDDADEDEGVVEDDADLTDAESFTLKDRQEAINETHPFGIRIWKPALYKKDRSVEKNAEEDIHSTPGGNVSRWLLFFNLAWTLIFGWWLALVAAVGGILCYLLAFAPGSTDYGRVLLGFARYIFYPFGKYVKLIQEDAYADEDEGEGRSISEYERWQSGDIEEGRLFFGPVRSLIGRQRREDDSTDDEDETSSLLGSYGLAARDGLRRAKSKSRLFGRGEWNLGRVVFFIFFYGLLVPLLFLVSMICWLLVFTIPMGRVTLLILRHLRRRPLALEFHSDTTSTRGAGSAPSSIILCTYRAVGPQYWKYTLDGTNIFLINLLGVVAFVIFDYWVLYTALGIRSPITNNILVFLLALFSIIPLAYFIGQAVASISAQSTMGVGAAINAFFSTVVEVFLYCVALNEGKARLVEGSLIGSIFAGILFLPGISMCFGAIKRKTQRFNVRSAGVTSTMLLFAVIGAFGPTLFYQIYGSHEINCHECQDENGNPLDRDCRHCFFAQIPAVTDPFYTNAVRPYSWFAAVLLFLSYIIGLLFTLRTHAATIWNSELDEKKLEKMEQASHRVANNTGAALPLLKRPSADYLGVNHPANSASGAPTPTTPTGPKSDIRETQLYKLILGQSLQRAGITSDARPEAERTSSTLTADGPHATPSLTDGKHSATQPQRKLSLSVPGLSTDDNKLFVRSMAELAATAAAVAARDATQNPRRASALARSSIPSTPSVERGAERSTSGAGLGLAPPPLAQKIPSMPPLPEEPPHTAATTEPTPPSGGHDAPNWGRVKSYTVLLAATLAYAIIAEILVNTVDSVLSHVDIDEKFLGITLFALVPNTTEFLNAISFAMNGNIALSMEIGSAYALQVCLLQIPALVLFSAVHGRFIDPGDVVEHTFSLIFPQWDMVTVILCVFLLSYMYGEGKSNYFKGSILILSYLVVIVGFYLTGVNNMSDVERGWVELGGQVVGMGGQQRRMGVMAGRGRGRGLRGNR